MGKPPRLSLPMAPLVDVTFLVLVFLLSMPLRTLGDHVSAELPRDRCMCCRGITVEPVPTLLVTLRRTSAGPFTIVRLLDTPLGVGEWGFRALDAGAAHLARIDEQWVGEIDAGGDVPHQDVIRAIDSLRSAGIDEILFVGAPRPRR